MGCPATRPGWTGKHKAAPAGVTGVRTPVGGSGGSATLGVTIAESGSEGRKTTRAISRFRRNIVVPAIRVENLGKKYRLAHATVGQAGYKTLRESLSGGVATLANRVRGKSARGTTEDFWALKDVSFEVQPGEVVGVIGRNGAGKSTLLKVLSRITKPTAGRAVIDGRVGSLLEVGTGFHPELTGRENVYLNGSILGMSRREISRKFDEIVAFSEVEQFLDTPVKRYSSGMYVRLAFAVAAHLEPEILIVDEVLSVGDAQFQQKCMGKIGEVARGGRTVFFVSHNVQAVTSLCSHALLFRSGTLCLQGPAHEVVRAYLESRTDRMVEAAWDEDSAPGNAVARLCSIRVINHRGEVGADHDIADAIDVEMEIRVISGGSTIDASIHVMNAESLCLFAVGVEFPGTGPVGSTEPGRYRATCRVPANFLNDGRHFVSAFIGRNSAEVIAKVPEVVTFMAHDYGTSRGKFLGKMIGAVRPIFDWDVLRIGGDV